MACNPPLQVELVAAPQAPAPARPGQARGPWQALIALRYAADPSLPAPLLDVSVDVDLAPELAGVARASPAAQWCPQQCRLRWELGTVAPDGGGIARAVVTAREDVTPEQAEAALLEGTVGRVMFTGRPGRALSGLGFEVGAVAGEAGGKGGAEAAFIKGTSLWFGELTVRP